MRFEANRSNVTGVSTGRTTQMSKPALPLCFPMKRKCRLNLCLWVIFLETCPHPKPSPGTTFEGKLRWGQPGQFFAIQTSAQYPIFALFLHMQIPGIHHVPHRHAFHSSKIANLTQQPQHLLEFFA
jgi:hypothetical protein